MVSQKTFRTNYTKQAVGTINTILGTISRSYAKLQFIQNKNDSGNFFRHKFAVQLICNEMNFRHFSRSIAKNSEMLYERWNNAPVI